jgi:hypothetical protein
MHALAFRLSLFLLLGVDWYADPVLLAPALAPLAAHLHSTENVCPSARYAVTLRRVARPPLRSSDNRPSMPSDFGPLISMCRSRQIHSEPIDSPLLYRFMSLRR